MTAIKRTNTVLAVLFLLALFALCGVTLLSGRTIASKALSDLRTEGQSLTARMDAATADTEGAINTALRRGNFAVEVYGGALRLMGKRVSEDAAVADYTVVRLENGAITFCNLETETLPDNSAAADEVALWAQTLSEADIPLLYVAYPKKTPRTDNGLPPDLPDWPVLKMNALVQHMEERGVEVLDLRDSFEALGDYSHLFYRTDHHWNIEGGFFAFQTICETLRTEYGVEMDPWYENASHYNWEVLENWFLGSQGKRVGTLFAGTDDFTVMTPDFATDFTFSIPSRETMREGTMEETILFPERIAQKDYYNANPYTYYAGGDYDYVTIENHLNPDGPSILVVRDSMTCALTPFLALDCSTLTLIDTRYFKADVAAAALELQPDIVLVTRG